MKNELHPLQARPAGTRGHRGPKSKFILAVLCLIPSLSLAGGSVVWEDVQVVLKKNPKLSRLVEKTFTAVYGGTADRLGRDFENLSGRRIAPYEFQAKTKEGTVFTLIIKCNQTFVLGDGSRVDDRDERITKAVDVVEVPHGVEIKVAAPSPAEPGNGKTIPPRFHGTWTHNPSGIHPSKGERPMTVSATTIEGHESLGKVTSVTIHSDDEITVTSEMSGEGEKWTDTDKFKLSDDGSTLNVNGHPKYRLRVP